MYWEITCKGKPQSFEKYFFGRVFEVENFINICISSSRKFHTFGDGNSHMQIGKQQSQAKFRDSQMGQQQSQQLQAKQLPATIFLDLSDQFGKLFGI